MQLQLDRMEKKFDKIISTKAKKKHHDHQPLNTQSLPLHSLDHLELLLVDHQVFFQHAKLISGVSFAVFTHKTTFFAGFKRSYSDPVEETPLQISGMAYIALSCSS